jgi:hypothetical protein
LVVIELFAEVDHQRKTNECHRTKKNKRGFRIFWEYMKGTRKPAKKGPAPYRKKIWKGNWYNSVIQPMKTGLTENMIAPRDVFALAFGAKLRTK